MRRLLAFLIAFVASTALAQGKAPVIDDLLNLSSAGGARLSPDGRWVVYSVTTTDWKADAFVGQLWIANLANGERRQLTRGAKASGNAEWSPNGEWISFTSAREDGKNQLFVMRSDCGEAQRITKVATGVGGYEWSKDGTSIAYVADDSDSKAVKEREDKYGAFTVVRKDYTYTHLYTFDVAKALIEPQSGRRRTSGRTLTLILQGELDRRVPIANGYELRQALEDRGVPVEMVVYKGFGHGITKPKSQRAVMNHNLAWFNHYLFGDPLPDMGFLGQATP